MKQNIFITGSSSGIGKDIATLFVEKGNYQVFGSVRKQADADRLQGELGGNFTPIIMDVSDEASVNEAFRTISSLSEGGLALLVNNAGIAVSGPLKHVTTEEFEWQMDVNVTGILRVTNAFLPLLGGSLDSKFTPGKIVNISSVAGLFSSPFLGPYCISKHAVESMSDVYRRELAIYDIKVVAVEPGPVKSEIWSKALDHEDKFSDTDYGVIWKGMRKRVEKSEANAISARVLSNKIYKIFKMKNPSPRYIVTKGKFFQWIFNYLVPNQIIDPIIKRSLRKAVGK